MSNSNFSGPLCTTELDQCVSNPCKNNANCKTVDGKAVCSCGDEFMGMTCKVKRSAKCKDNPCSANNTISCTDSEILSKHFLQVNIVFVVFRVVQIVFAKWASTAICVNNHLLMKCAVQCLANTAENASLEQMQQLNVSVRQITTANFVKISRICAKKEFVDMASAGQFLDRLYVNANLDGKEVLAQQI